MTDFPIIDNNHGEFYLVGKCERCHQRHNSGGYFYISVDGTVLCFACFKDEVENHTFEFGEYQAHSSNKHPEILRVNKLQT